MRSKMAIKGHPIHPMIVPFPIAFLTGATVFDWLGRGYNSPAMWQTAGHLALAGIATALLAAVPGLIDLFRTVPPDSSGRQRGTLHMSVNLLAVAMFGLAAWWRESPAAPPTYGILLIQTFALAFLSIGGWLGGTLVTRNQIGVDHRYANAGKWREEHVHVPMRQPNEPIVVATSDELKPGQMKLLHLEGSRVVLARTDEGYCAFEDHCTHKGGSLCDGALVNGFVQCPWHGSQFDVRTGAVKAGPAGKGIKTYPVEERARSVCLFLPEVDAIRV